MLVMAESASATLRPPFQTLLLLYRMTGHQALLCTCPLAVLWIRASCRLLSRRPVRVVEAMPPGCGFVALLWFSTRALVRLPANRRMLAVLLVLICCSGWIVCLCSPPQCCPSSSDGPQCRPSIRPTNPSAPRCSAPAATRVWQTRCQHLQPTRARACVVLCALSWAFLVGVVETSTSLVSSRACSTSQRRPQKPRVRSRRRSCASSKCLVSKPRRRAASSSRPSTALPTGNRCSSHWKSASCTRLTLQASSLLVSRATLGTTSRSARTSLAASACSACHWSLKCFFALFAVPLLIMRPHLLHNYLSSCSPSHSPALLAPL
eukprot:m.86946 g.86946  ORF g.86946 m.86946 type:complete len:321 (+) comp8446_c0_seq2:1064-2026(+)